MLRNGSLHFVPCRWFFWVRMERDTDAREWRRPAATKAERRGKNERRSERRIEMEIRKTNAAAAASGEIRKDRQYPRETRERGRHATGLLSLAQVK